MFEFYKVKYDGNNETKTLGFPNIFIYFDEFAFGRIQSKKGQNQILAR